VLSSELRKIGATLAASERDFELPERTTSTRENKGLGWLVGVVMLTVLASIWWYWSKG
jgi:hypothetical protein